MEYIWVSIDKDREAMRASGRSTGTGAPFRPSSAATRGVLVEASNAELADRLGLHTKAKWSFYVMIVVGGSLADLTASI